MSCSFSTSGLLIWRVFILGITIVAFILAIVSVTSAAFFRISSDSEREFDRLVAKYTRNTEDDSVAVQMYESLNYPSYGSTIDLWNAHIQFQSIEVDRSSNTTIAIKGEEETLELNTEYITCNSGKMFIQLAQGIGIVSCVFNCAALILCIFMFFYAVMAKFPLVFYSFLSSAFYAISSGIMLYFYYSGFCNSTPLQDAKWEISTGFVLLIVSCFLLFIVCCITLCT